METERNQNVFNENKSNQIELRHAWSSGNRRPPVVAAVDMVAWLVGGARASGGAPGRPRPSACCCDQRRSGPPQPAMEEAGSDDWAALERPAGTHQFAPGTL